MPTIDSPRVLEPSTSNPGGSPRPSSSTVNRSRPAARLADDHDLAAGLALRRRVAVLDGVLEQLGEHHRDRGRGLRAQHAEGALPADPRPAAERAHVGDHAAEPVGDVVEGDALLDRLAERLVHDRDRADPAYRLLERGLRVGAVHPAGLQPQQRGHGLEVVLHPVVDLADGGVLGDQLAVAAAQVGDVADQDQRADQLALRPQRDGPHDQRDRLGADLGVPVGATAQHRAQRLLVGPQPRRHQLAGDLGEPQPVEVAGQAQPPVDRERVGAGVDDPALLVDAQEAVADPRGVGVVAALARHREVAAGDHHG